MTSVPCFRLECWGSCKWEKVLQARLFPRKGVCLVVEVPYTMARVMEGAGDIVTRLRIGV